MTILSTYAPKFAKLGAALTVTDPYHATRWDYEGPVVSCGYIVAATVERLGGGPFYEIVALSGDKESAEVRKAVRALLYHLKGAK